MADALRRQEASDFRSAWRIRLVLSVLFFFLFYVMETQDISIGGVTSEKIYDILYIIENE